LLLHCGEDTSFFSHPFNISSDISRKADGQHSCFLSTPLYDSSHHECADEHIEYSDCGCCDLFTPLDDHDAISFAIDISMSLVFDDLLVDEVETPQDVEALQPELMVISDPHYLEVNSTLDHKFVETPKASHHSPFCIEDQSSSQISHHPPKSHDPITQALEESNTMSTHVKHKLSFLFMFPHLSWSTKCACLLSMHSVLHNHDTSA